MKLASVLTVLSIAILCATIGASSVEGEATVRSLGAVTVKRAVETGKFRVAKGFVETLASDEESLPFRPLRVRNLREEGDEAPAPIVEPIVPVVTLPKEFVGNAYRNNYVTASTNGKVVRFFTTSPGLDVHPETLSDGLTIMIGGEPGTHVLCAYTALGDVPSEVSRCIITLKGPQPPPGPQPNPQPTPGPTPTPGPNPPPPPPPPAPVVVTSPTLWIVAITKKTGERIEVSDVLADRPMWQAFKAAGHQYEFVDSANENLVARFKAQIDKNGGLPCVILMAPDGTWLNTNELAFPANAAAMKALIAKYSGK